MRWKLSGELSRAGCVHLAKRARTNSLREDRRMEREAWQAEVVIIMNLCSSLEQGP